MKIQKHISLELAKQIAEAANEKEILIAAPDLYWVEKTGLRDKKVWGGDNFEIAEYAYLERFPTLNSFPAYDLSELGEMGLRGFGSWKEDDGVFAADCYPYSNAEYEKSEVEARGKMFLYLIKNNLYK